MDKAGLRKNAKEIRRGLDVESLSRAICAQIARMPEFKRAENVLLFHPTCHELNILPLCECDKNFYLPRVEGEKLLVCPYNCDIKLEKSGFNILEPCSEPVSPEIIDFAIIPCLMADKQHFRLGYGGGFYDRFIPSLHKDCLKIAVVADELLIDRLPVEKFDLPVDYIVTEKGIV